MIRIREVTAVTMMPNNAASQVDVPLGALSVGSSDELFACASVSGRLVPVVTFSFAAIPSCAVEFCAASTEEA